MAPATFRYRFYPGKSPEAAYNIKDQPGNVRTRAWLESSKAVDPVGEVDGPTFYLVSKYRTILCTGQAELIDGEWQPVADSRTEQARFDLAVRSEKDFKYNLMPLNHSYEYLDLDEKASFITELIDTIDAIKQVPSSQA